VSHGGRSALWHNRDFLHLWSASTISQLGAQLGLIAIPLIAALALDASAMQMGILTAAGGVPRLLLGFIAGTWVDRLPRRPIMIWMDASRAATFAVIPVAAWLDMLTIEVLLGVAVLGGCQSVFFDAAWAATMPSLVGRKDLADANGKLMSSYSLSQIVGPALAGTLIAWLTGPMVMWIQAATFALSGWFITRIRGGRTRPNRRAQDEQHFWREMREGLHALFASRVVRPLTTSMAVLNLGGYVFLSVYVLFMTDELGLSSAGVGAVFATGGIGSLIGSMAAGPLASRFGVGQTILWSAIGFGVFGLCVPLALLEPSVALPLVMFAEFSQWGTLQIFNVNRFSLRQALTPDRLMGRVSASSTTIIGGMQPIGSLIGGAIGELVSVQAALIVGCAGMFIAAWWVWDSPIPSIQTLPEQPEEGLRHVVDETPVTIAG
jgi:predicted MFS family arabinose efflux permease